VSEEKEGSESGSDGIGAGIDPVAVALALGGASREKADAFLNDQSRLIEVQMHHLHEQFKQLRLAIWEKRLGVLLRIATAFTGLAIAMGLTFLVWDAAQSNGLLIEPFSVPPDLAARGLTGEVVATKVLDQLVAMQSQTSSQRAPKSYANSWDEKGIKLDVPETGMSLTELDNFLRQKLGNDTHVTGEVVRNANGVSLTARAGATATDSVTGLDTDLDPLVHQLAESVYRMTQPYRYGVYLAAHGRMADALPILRALTVSGTPEDRPWGYNLLSLAALDRTGVQASFALMRQAVAVDPDFIVSQVNVARYEANLSLPEEAIPDTRKMLAMSPRAAREIFLPRVLPAIQANVRAELDLQLGAYHDAAAEQEFVVTSGIPGRWGLSADLARAQAGEHDLAAARATLAAPTPDAGLVRGASILYTAWSRAIVASQVHDWAGVVAQARMLDTALAPYPGERDFVPTLIVPLAAYAQARLGRFTAAEAAIAGTPPACYDCLRVRARIAELQGQHDRADWWFDRAIAAAPDVVFAYADFGQALLARGHPDAAIVQFRLAGEKGPHFADPLEGWGEALMVENQSHLALAKFAEAEKYAPNWGRLHLKWGEALGYAGKPNEAKKQFALAAGLDLAAGDKSELMSFSVKEGAS
jgi:tetratricopeptide (TPR) repeat protein